MSVSVFILDYVVLMVLDLLAGRPGFAQNVLRNKVCVNHVDSIHRKTNVIWSYIQQTWVARFFGPCASPINSIQFSCHKRGNSKKKFVYRELFSPYHEF